MSGLRLSLLGPPRLERDGVPLEFDARKNVALIAYLAVTGTHHTREALVTLLWPELEPSRARAGLRRNLSVLKKTLANEWLVVIGKTIGPDPSAGLHLDVARFRGLLQGWQNHGHPASDTCPRCLDTLAEAVALYRGDFMAGFSLRDSAAYDEWQFFQTESLRRELASALERLVRGHSQGGEHERAIPYARRWVALDPLHEPAHRHLMRLYARDGQRAAALRQYEECARILEAELGLPPAKETAALYERIRAPSTEREGPLPPAPQHNLPDQLTPFVGRQEELAHIAARLHDPGCRLLTLVGPGGVGKTRLALRAAEALVLRGTGRFEHGVFFVSLAPLHSTDALVPTVAQALGISPLGAEPLRQLLLPARQGAAARVGQL